MQLTPEERHRIIERGVLARAAAQRQAKRRARLKSVAWACLGCFGLLVVIGLAAVVLTGVYPLGQTTARASATPYPTYTPYPTLKLGAALVHTATPYATDAPLPTYTFHPTNAPRPTYTPYPTNTPLSTYTPYPTNTAQPTHTPLPSRTALPPSPIPRLIGVLRVDHWLFEIAAVHSDPGKDITRQIVVLLGNITNQGTMTDTFVAYGTLLLKDSHGRTYEDDRSATWAAMDKYGTEYAASMTPGAREYLAVAFDVPSSERTFTIIPGSLVAGWTGDITITVP